MEIPTRNERRKIKRYFAWLLGVLAAVGSFAVHAAEPVLRIDTGRHIGPIRQLLLDRANRYLFTAALDEPLRVYDVASGALLQTVRLPQVEGHRPFSVLAVAPDGQVLAAARNDDQPGPAGKDDGIYLLNWHSGRVLRRIPGQSGVTSLCFSPDGARLAVARAQDGIRIYSVSSGEEMGRDAAYAAAVVALEFAPDGRLISSAGDGALRLYDSSHKLLRKAAVASGGAPAAVHFSPDGKKIAVGYRDTPLIEVYSGEDLSLLYRPTTTGVESGDLHLLVWSQNGAALFAAGTWHGNNGYAIRRFTAGGQGTFVDTLVALEPLTALLSLPQEQLAFATADSAWGVLGATGHRVHTLLPETPRYLPERLSLDRTGSRVKFRFTVPGAPAGTAPVCAAFSVLDHALSMDCSAEARPGNERPPALPSSLPEGTLSANVSGDARLVVAAHKDGTIRWYSAADGRELLAFLPHVDRKRWIVWTPSGYYDASAGGENLLGWQLDRGPDHAADFFRIGLFRSHLYRPDVTARALFTKNEAEAVTAANTEAGRQPEALAVRRLLPPIVTILEPSDGGLIKTSPVTVRVAVRSPSGEPLRGVQALVQGRKVQTGELRDIVLKGPLLPTDGMDAEGSLYSLSVTIPQEDSTIAILAETATSRSEAAQLRLRWAGPKAKTTAPTSDLYVLAVGTSKYRQSRLRLEYPAKDAKDLAAAFKAQEGKRYRRVVLRVLLDDQATRGSILDGLAWLREKASPEDTAVFFLAGHGINEASDGKYYYLPYDAEMGAAADTMVDAGQIQTFLSGIRGKALLFIDTCHSGNVLGPQRGQGGLDVNRIVTDLASVENGVVVYAASTGGQVSRESGRWSNGAFTKAVVEGLRGKADYSRSGRVTVSSLELYISNRVKELTFDEQTPTTAKPSTVPDFLIASVQPPRPLYQKAWFWGVLGATAAVVAATSIGLAVALQPKPPSSDGGLIMVSFPGL